MATSPQEKRKATNSRSAGSSSSSRTKVRYAVVGLGHIAQAAVLPGFSHARRNSELAALVSGDQAKLRSLGQRYDVKALNDYRGFRRCLIEENIDAVYIATPNSEHAHFAKEAAGLGAHILCEKPLAVTERECLEMIRACERAGVRLMTAYRLHFEAANLNALRAIRSGRIGEPRIFTSVFSFQIKDRANIRLQSELGGGPLHDIGIYCINAARTAFAAEPVEVQAWSAWSGDPRFEEVDETVSVLMRFPGDRIAHFTCSYGAADTNWYQVLGTRGDVCVAPSYEYASGLEFELTVGDKSRTHQFSKRDQFAAELVYFSDCIRTKRDPEPSGWEGLADVRIIRALQLSLDRREPIRLHPLTRPDHAVPRHPTPRQQIDRPPVSREPQLAKARSAS